MKKLLIAVLGIVMLASCKKEKIETNSTVTEPVFTKKLVRTEYVNSNGSVETDHYMYDAQGRVSRHENADYLDLFDYSTPGKLLITEKYVSSGAIKKTYDCTLNEKGGITNIIIKNPSGGTILEYVYTYDSNNWISNAEVIGYSSPYFIEYTIADNNVTGFKIFSNGILVSTRQNLYDKTKINSLGWNTIGWYPSDKLFGRVESNPVSEIKDFNNAGQLTLHWKKTYETDAAGYLTKAVTENILTGLKYTMLYYYQ